MKADLIQVCDVAEVSRSQAGGTRLAAAVGARMRAIERRFPSASEGLLSILDQAIVSGTGFFTAAIIGRATSPEQFGVYYVVLSVVLIMSGVQEQVIAAPYMVHSKRRQGRDLAEYAGSMWLHHLGLTVLTVLGLALAIVLTAAAGNTGALPGLWALLGAGPFLLLRDAIRRYAFAELQVTSAIALDAIVAAVQLSGLALLGHYEQLNLLSIYAVMGGACCLACFLTFLLNPPRIQFVRERSLPDWRGNWDFSKWALWSFLVRGTTPYVTLWFLGLAMGTSATAVLGACTTIIGVTNVVLAGVSNVLTPQAAQAYATGGSSNLRRILTFSAAFLVLTIGGFSLLLLLTGDWLAVAVFGPPYQGTAGILITLAMYMLMNGLGLVAGNGLWAIDHSRCAFVGDVYGAVVTLIASASLILPWGALGAALAMLIGAATAAVVRSIMLARYLADDELDSGVAANSMFSR
jgi:O-antigen/teichoic acid export membrane protein